MRECVHHLSRGHEREEVPRLEQVAPLDDAHADVWAQGPVNVSLLVAESEAHRCGCLPPTEHMWFHELAKEGKAPCYSVTPGVGCEEAAATYLPWAQGEADAVRFFGLSATGYVQNRDMEGECNGLLTYDAVQKLNSTPIVQGNRLLSELHDSIWRPSRV